jgi:hypothetical protein
MIEGIIAVALVTITACAIIAAYFSWVQGRQHIVVEAFETIRSDAAGALEMSLAVSVCNRRRSSIQPLFLEVRGLPDADVNGIEGAPKAPRQARDQAPFPDMPVAPFDTREATFNIAFDWQAARAAAPAGGGDLRWQAVVTFNDRHRRGKRWSQTVDMAFQGAELHRLTSNDSPVVERRRPGRPFSGPPVSSSGRRPDVNGRAS